MPVAEAFPVSLRDGNDGDAVETLGRAWRYQLCGHLGHYVVGYHPVPLPIPLAADFQGHREEQCLHVTTVGLADPDIGSALLRTEIGCVDVRHRPAKGQ